MKQQQSYEGKGYTSFVHSLASWAFTDVFLTATLNFNFSLIEKNSPWMASNVKTSHIFPRNGGSLVADTKLFWFLVKTCMGHGYIYDKLSVNLDNLFLIHRPFFIFSFQKDLLSIFFSYFDLNGFYSSFEG